MSEHYTDGRRWSYISKAWIFADGWNDREEIARLEAKVRELEERLDRVEQERDQWKKALHSLTPGGSEFANDPSACVEWIRKARSSQHNTILAFKGERDQLRDGYRRVENDKYQLLRAIDDVLTVYDTDLACRYIAELKQDNATLRARVGELEEALRASRIGLDDWLNQYASELCDEERVKEAVKRIEYHGGTLAYIASLQDKNKRALERKEEHGTKSND